MSITPEEDLSPAEEWLRQGEMTPVEATLGGVIHDRGYAAEDLAGSALALGAAFILYRRFMSRRLREETRGEPPTPAQLIRKTADAFSAFAPRWALIVAPALISGYRQGMRETGYSNMNPEWLNQTANSYAAILGAHINEVSAEALLAGYQAQLNRRVAARTAADRSIDAFGVAPRTMKTLVNIWTTPPDPNAKVTTSAPMPNRMMDRADMILASALQKRSNDIGQTEAYSAKAQAKQLVWLQALQEGLLPRDAFKEWVTADDERVCPTCGPLHERTVPINEQFVISGDVKVWGPALHVNCRCDMRLKTMAQLQRSSFRELAVAKSAWSVVSKARPGDPYDRDKKGRFSSAESRPAKTAERAMDPRVARIFQDLDQKPSTETMSQTLRRLGLEKPKLERTEMEKPKLSKPKLEGKQSLARPTLGRSKMTSAPMTKDPLPKSKLPKGQLGQKGKLDASKIKLPSDLKAKRPMPPAAQRTNDKWINTPNGKPMFGIFWDQGMEHLDTNDRSLIIADEDTLFYPDEAMEYGRGATLGQGLMDYWDMRVFDDLQQRFEMDDAFEPGSGMLSYHDDKTGITTFIPYDTYETAWHESVAADASPFESSEVEVFEVGPDGTHKAVLMRSFDVADKLSIHDEVEYLTPLVGVAFKYNTEQGEESFHGVAINPGKWRITDVYPRTEFEGYLPYKIVYIEPDDLFD